MRILSARQKLSMLERCPYNMERFDFMNQPCVVLSSTAYAALQAHHHFIINYFI